MLALAPLQSHSPHNAAPTKSSSRSKQASRRPPSASASVSSFSSSSSGPGLSSTSSASVASTSTPARPPVVASHFPPGPIPLKREAPVQFAPSCPQVHPPQPRQQPPPPPEPLHTIPTPSEPPQTSSTPFDIHAYPSNDLLRLLALLLNQIATANDALSPPSLLQSAADGATPASPTATSPGEHPPIWRTLTTASRSALASPNSPLTFHARNIPSISLESYLLRILRYCPTTNEVFLSLLVYFDRMSKLAQDATGSRFAIDSYNVHRLVIAGVTVASKFFSDVFYTNSRYAKVGGLPQAELNQLELQFLLLNDFRLVISSEEMQRYAEQLILFSQSQSDDATGENSRNPPAAVATTAPTPVQPSTLPMHVRVPAPPPAPVLSRPMQSMGAYDAYGGTVLADPGRDEDADARRVKTPRVASASAPAGSDLDEYADEVRERDESSAHSEAETDTDAETDDEPTIRPTHSCASSETQSIYSTDASEDGEEPGDVVDVSPRVRPRQHRWSNGVPAEDRHMASP